MALEFLGTNYGGWLLDMDLVPQGSTVISAGVGEDISFDLELIKRKECKIVGIDPTPKSHRYIESASLPHNFILIKKALDNTNDSVIKLFKNNNPLHVSESILGSHGSVNNFDYYLTETVNLQNLFDAYNNISVIKMDIEGSEYKVIESLVTVPDSVRQLCVEFHHFCSAKTLDDTKAAIQILKNLGFTKYAEKPSTKSLNELTLWRP